MTMSVSTTTPAIDFATTTIRDIVDRFPKAMPVLADAGMDLCCGGGHTIPEAAKLHGVDGAALIAAVSAAIGTDAAVR